MTMWSCDHDQCDILENTKIVHSLDCMMTIENNNVHSHGVCIAEECKNVEMEKTAFSDALCTGGLLTCPSEDITHRPESTIKVSVYSLAVASCYAGRSI